MEDVWVVAGAPGSGKTTVANMLLGRLRPSPALLDKDTMYGSFVSALLAKSSLPQGEREGEWYDMHIKKYEYEGMIATCREIRSKGCPVLLSAPFTSQIHDAAKWNEWVEQLGGEKVRLVWVQTDKETIRSRLETRKSERDTGKLARFDDFVGYMQLDSPPPVDHIAIDNRFSASHTLEDQVAMIQV